MQIEVKINYCLAMVRISYMLMEHTGAMMKLEDIADYTELSLDTIKELASQSMQFA